MCKISFEHNKRICVCDSVCLLCECLSVGLKNFKVLTNKNIHLNVRFYLCEILSVKSEAANQIK